MHGQISADPNQDYDRIRSHLGSSLGARVIGALPQYHLCSAAYLAQLEPYCPLPPQQGQRRPQTLIPDLNW